MLSLLIQRQIFDLNMKLISSRAERSKSFLKNFLGALYRQTSQLTFSMLDIDGVARNFAKVASFMQMPAGPGGVRLYSYSSNISVWGQDIGITLGTGSASVSAQDYYMAADIDHGTDAGELEYFGCLIGDVVISGSNAYFDVERVVRNSSGGTIIVKEFGLGVTCYRYPHLIVRDAYSGSGDWSTILNGEYMKVVYRVQVTV